MIASIQFLALGLQSLTITETMEDEHDKVEWQGRGWCVVEPIYDEMISPFIQAVLRNFQQQECLTNVFLRPRIQVTNNMI